MTVVERGLLLSHDRNVLAENGGYLSFPNDWRRLLLFTKRQKQKG